VDELRDAQLFGEIDWRGRRANRCAGIGYNGQASATKSDKRPSFVFWNDAAIRVSSEQQATQYQNEGKTVGIQVTDGVGKNE